MKTTCSRYFPDRDMACNSTRARQTCGVSETQACTASSSSLVTCQRVLPFSSSFLRQGSGGEKWQSTRIVCPTARLCYYLHRLSISVCCLERLVRAESHHAYWLPGLQFSLRLENNIPSSCEEQSQKWGWLVLLFYILEVPVSNLSSNTRQRNLWSFGWLHGVVW
jgi:hypothetical protein